LSCIHSTVCSGCKLDRSVRSDPISFASTGDWTAPDELLLTGHDLIDHGSARACDVGIRERAIHQARKRRDMRSALIDSRSTADRYSFAFT
jgi:hypothetical protein